MRQSEELAVMDQQDDKKGHRFKDLTGQRFGMLVAKRCVKVGEKYKWYCDCDCGTKDFLTYGDNLKRLRTRNCGCSEKDIKGTWSRKRAMKAMEKKLNYNNTERFCCECSNCIVLPNREMFCIRMQYPRSQFEPAIRDGVKLCRLFELDSDYFEYDEESGNYIIE